MPTTASQIFTPIATPPVARTDWPSAILGGVLAAGAVGYMTGWACWHIGDTLAAGHPSAHLNWAFHSIKSVLGFARPGIFYEYWEALQEAGWPALWRVGAVVSASISAGGYTTFKLSRPTNPILHHLGRQNITESELKKEAQSDLARDGGEVARLGNIPISRGRMSRSVGVFGSTGGGKTVTINSLTEKLDQNGYRMLIIDGPKGDFSTSDGFYKDALRIAPWHAGAVWDISADCPTRAAAKELAARLIPESADPMWSNAARMVFTVAACHLIETRSKNWGWGDLWDICCLPVQDLQPLAAAHYPPAMAVLADAESKTTQGIMINFTSFMSEVFEMALAWRDAPPNWVRFSFINWLLERGQEKDQRHVLLLTSGEWELTSRAFSGAVLGLLSKVVMSSGVKESTTRRVMTVIDEIAQQGRIDGIEKWLELGRSKGCSLLCATQSPQQLIKIYGREELSSWMAMLGVRVFVRTLGNDDQTWVSDQIGKRVIDMPTNSVSSSGGGFTVTNSYQRTEEAVIHPSELQLLGPGPNGVTVYVDSFHNVAKTTIPYPPFKPIPGHEPFDLNPNWNTSVSKSTALTSMDMDSIIECINPSEALETLDLYTPQTEFVAPLDLIPVNNMEDEGQEPKIDDSDSAALDAMAENIAEPGLDAAISAALDVDVEGIGQLIDAMDDICPAVAEGPQVIEKQQPEQKKRQYISRKKLQKEVEK